MSIFAVSDPGYHAQHIRKEHPVSIKLCPESRPTAPFHQIVPEQTFRLTLRFCSGRRGRVTGPLAELAWLADNIRRHTTQLASYVITTVDGQEVRTWQ